MSEREQKIIESISDALPKMSEFDKGYLLGSAERMVSEKEKIEKENKDKKAGQEVRKMLRKIYQELVLIRKELQTIHSSKEFNPQIVLDERIIQISMKSYLEEI